MKKFREAYTCSYCFLLSILKILKQKKKLTFMSINFNYVLGMVSIKKNKKLN